jgi:hypothetical protein
VVEPSQLETEADFEMPLEENQEPEIENSPEKGNKDLALDNLMTASPGCKSSLGNSNGDAEPNVIGRNLDDLPAGKVLNFDIFEDKVDAFDQTYDLAVDADMPDQARFEQGNKCLEEYYSIIMKDMGVQADLVDGIDAAWNVSASTKEIRVARQFATVFAGNR